MLATAQLSPTAISPPNLSYNGINYHLHSSCRMTTNIIISLQAKASHRNYTGAQFRSSSNVMTALFKFCFKYPIF